MFTATAGSVQFDSFALDAANIAGGTPPSATTGITMAEDPTHTQVTLTWTPGTNSDGSASTSFVVMRELGLRDALTTDKHFAEAGFRILLTKN